MARSLRHLSRTLVMQSLYAVHARDKSAEDVFSYVVNEFGDELHDDSFAKQTLEGVIEHMDDINTKIAEAAPDWPLSKIALIDLCVLQIGIFEIIYNDDVPDLVAINEAVEVSKKFGGYKSSKFINAVLSNVMHSKK